MTPRDYDGTAPVFRPEDYFAGNGRATGIMQFRNGHPRRSFTLATSGRWDGATLTLDEVFRFDKGAPVERSWTIRKLDDHRYEANAADLVRPAVAEAWGCAFHMTYDIRIPWRGRTVVLRFDDWSWLQADGVLVNIATIRKFGLRVGGLTGFFTRGS